MLYQRYSRFNVLPHMVFHPDLARFQRTLPLLDVVTRCALGGGPVKSVRKIEARTTQSDRTHTVRVEARYAASRSTSDYLACVSTSQLLPKPSGAERVIQGL